MHGADNFFEPVSQVFAFQQEMRNAKADWQMVYYANAVHGFTEPAAGNDQATSVAYNEKATKKSWQHMLMFIEEAFAGQ